MAASPASSVFEQLREKKQAKQQWVRILKDGLDADTWGQSIEATEEYEKLHRTLEAQVPNLQLTAEERTACMRVAHAVALRMHTLLGEEATMNDQTHSAQQRSTQKLSLDEVKALMPVLDDLFVRAQTHFPIALTNFQPLERKEAAASVEVFVAHEDRLEKEEHGSLLAPRTYRGDARATDEGRR
jgi:hypothetical protein